MPQEGQNIKISILRDLQKLSGTTASGTNNTEQCVAMNMIEFTFYPENGGTRRKCFRPYEKICLNRM